MHPKPTRKRIQKVSFLLDSYSFAIEAIDALSTAVLLLTERGRFSAAANNQKTIAEIYETDMVDYEKSMKAYESAADWYSGEDASAQVFLTLIFL